MARRTTYTPKPIDTSSIVLTGDILELTEQLAENAHEHWAQERIQQGWTYGKERNDEKKEHPCLVPYDQLSDDEKKFDRLTAMETLKAIVALGYHIEQNGIGEEEEE